MVRALAPEGPDGGCPVVDDLQLEVWALEERGEAAVREALIENLAGFEFELVPYTLDPAPQGVRVIEQTLAKKH